MGYSTNASKLGVGDPFVHSKIGKFFTVLGVDASQERIEGYVEATLAIPWKIDRIYYFLGALAKLTQGKRDGYSTAPQPGEIWAAAESLIPRGEWEPTPHQGTLPPRWWRRNRCAGGKSGREWSAQRDPR